MFDRSFTAKKRRHFWHSQYFRMEKHNVFMLSLWHTLQPNSNAETATDQIDHQRVFLRFHVVSIRLIIPHFPTCIWVPLCKCNILRNFHVAPVLSLSVWPRLCLSWVTAQNFHSAKKLPINSLSCKSSPPSGYWFSELSIDSRTPPTPSMPKNRVVEKLFA